MVWLMGDAISVTLLSSVLQTTLPLMMVGLGQTLVILTGGSTSQWAASSACQLPVRDADDPGLDMIVWVPLILRSGSGLASSMGS